MSKRKNNIEKLDRKIHFRICWLIRNSMMYKDVPSDPEVRSACKEAGFMLSPQSVSNYINGVQGRIDYNLIGDFALGLISVHNLKKNPDKHLVMNTLRSFDAWMRLEPHFRAYLKEEL